MARYSSRRSARSLSSGLPIFDVTSTGIGSSCLSREIRKARRGIKPCIWPTA